MIWPFSRQPAYPFELDFEAMKRWAVAATDEEFADMRTAFPRSLWPGLVEWRALKRAEDPYVWRDAFAGCP